MPVRQLVDDFARYLYLPRLSDSEVLTHAIQDGTGFLTWQSDTFAYAESLDDSLGRYRGLRSGQVISISPDDAGRLVRPDVARRQMDSETPSPSPPSSPGSSPQTPGARPESGGGASPASVERNPRRFHGTVALDPERVGRDASRIADEVIAHLAGQVGAEVTVTLEIAARIPGGASDQMVRTVTENSRTLKFTTQGFESD